MTAAIRRLLSPRSIAIVGASPTPGSLGGSVLANLDRFGYRGDIHLINPNRDEIGGRKCLKTTADLPHGVDCAVLAIPGARVLDTVRSCAERGVGSLVVFSAGFAELGDDGRAAQAELARIAREAGMAVEGPNCLGFVNFVDGVPLTFGYTEPAPLEGRRAIGVVSQSGAMATVIRAALNAHGIPFSYSISTGNEAVNGLEDFLAYLIDDAATHVVAMVVEQFRQPKYFLELARRARAAGKRIVLLHPGRSAAAKSSAQTHTGAMSGDYDVMRALVTHEGIAVVDTLEELLDVSEMFVRWPQLPARGTAMLTESGAFKGMTLDFCESVGLDLPKLSPASADVIGAIAPGLIFATNPVDLTAQSLMDPDLYRKTMTPLIADDNFGSLLLAIIVSSPAMSKRKTQPVIDTIAAMKPQKPVVYAVLGDDVEVVPENVAAFRALNVPFFRSPERAQRALAHVTRAGARQQPAARRVSVPRQALPHGTIAEYRAKTILAAAGIAVPPGELATTLDEAKQIAGRIGYPVALKAQSADLSHKSDAGGVVLRLADAAALEAGWAKMHANIARARPGLTLDGVLVEAMGTPGVELILGARNDPDWGPILVVGLGGVFAEALHDVRVLAPDLDAAAIADEIMKLKGAALLRPFRGAPARDVKAAAAIAETLAAFIVAHPEVAEIDINPVMVGADGQGALALDALMVTR